MKRINVLIIGIFLAASSGFFPGCVTDTATLKIEKSLPQSKLAYYNDSFDNFRTDLWEKAGYIHFEKQLNNFKLANLQVKDGQLVIETKPGYFSKAGLVSKYKLKGDFDIQFDCQISFPEDLRAMDQVLSIVLLDKTANIEKIDSANISLAKKEGWSKPKMFTGYRKKGRYNLVNKKDIGHIFNGSLRFIRVGDKIDILYRAEGESRWNTAGRFRFTSNVVVFTFALQNFLPKRKSIGAEEEGKATFDNFRINAAEEIIEEEI